MILVLIQKGDPYQTSNSLELIARVTNSINEVSLVQVLSPGPA
jgi:hypothetical protein